jgi:hypothetical protein
MKESPSEILARLNFNPIEKKVELFQKLEENKAKVKEIKLQDYNFQFNANTRLNELQNQILTELQGSIEKEDEIALEKLKPPAPVHLLQSGFKPFLIQTEITEHESI